MIATSFWNADGKPIPAEEFLQNLFGELPNFFKNENELRTLWSNPITRKERVAREEATTILGGVEKIRNTFIDFQKHLYKIKVA